MTDMPDLTARITEMLGVHRIESGMRIGRGERVEWLECLGCDWKSELFDYGAPGIEIARRGHLSTLIAAEVDKWYVPRSFRIDPEGYPE